MTDLIKNNYLEPKTFEEALKFSKIIADSDLAPKDYKGKPGNVLIAMQMGLEVGLKPMQAIQNIAVINGRPSIWGDAMLALIMNSSEFEYCNEWIDGDPFKGNATAYCSLKRKGHAEKISSFSIDDAKKAGVFGKAGPWTHYLKRMLQLRARSFGLRDVFPDILKGLRVAEEEQDYSEKDITNQTNQSETVSGLKRMMASSINQEPEEIIEEYKIQEEKPNEDLSTRISKAINYFDKKGIDQSIIISHFKLQGIHQITDEHLGILRTIMNAAKDGSFSLEEAFGIKKEQTQEELNKEFFGDE